MDKLADVVARCRRCPRLVAYRERIAGTRRAAYREWTYWGRPVPGFGTPEARLLVIGLAPAAHGGNRTGRIFTGDRSGDWLYRALHRFGFANQPRSVDRSDGLRLIDTYITAAAHCAPPANQPTPEEFDNCLPYLVREMRLLRRVCVVVALGKIAFDRYLVARRALGAAVPKPRPHFHHGCVHDLGDVTLIGSYHPSQRNTQTGLLTEKMFDAVFRQARSRGARGPGGP
ncbi:uracil-DNA glycosylase [Candidatus Binatia bacterium]|nr:uracil-DNA glycosylase [Candidatus Binatia bacterium]